MDVLDNLMRLNNRIVAVFPRKKGTVAETTIFIISIARSDTKPLLIRKVNKEERNYGKERLNSLTLLPGSLLLLNKFLF